MQSDVMWGVGNEEESMYLLYMQYYVLIREILINNRSLYKFSRQEKSKNEKKNDMRTSDLLS